MENPYDRVHYRGLPVPPSHPDRLAQAAALSGYKPVSPEKARVIELGSGDGTNLVAMAYYMPDASFTGVDLSATNIERSRALAGTIGLSNIAFHERDIGTLGDDLGTFDYVLLHGVLSWVSEAVEERIWAFLRDQLSPDGVAFVSYNTHPGWQIRRIVRDTLRSKLGEMQAGKARCDAARSLSAVLAKAADPNSSYGTLLQGEFASIVDYPDHYIEHEYFSPDSRSRYYGQFIETARKFGLAVAGEMTPPEFGTGQVAAHRERLAAAGIKGDSLEEYVDILCGRQFRASVVCHSDRPSRPFPGDAPDSACYFAAPAKPQSEEPLLREGRRQSFELPNGVVITTENAVLKGALIELFDAWPLGRTVDELLDTACASLRERGLSPKGPDRETDRARLWEDLGHLVVASHIELRFRQLRLPPKITDAPRLHPLSRVLLEQAGIVATPRHEVVALSRHGQMVARLCDGAHALETIVRELQSDFIADPPPPEAPGEAPLSPPDLAAALPGYVASVVLGLGRAGAFEG